MVCNKQKRVSKQEATEGSQRHRHERAANQQKGKATGTGRAPVVFAEERRGAFGKEICLVKNKRHKHSPKKEEKVKFCKRRQ